MVMLLLVLVVAGIIVWLVIRNNAKWKTIEAGTANAVAEIEAKHAFLKSNQVKSRIRSSDTMGAVQGSGHGSIKLEVPEKYVDQAIALIANNFKE
ncbi:MULTISPECIES: hypothetical protein [Paenibacillus]|uniref:DUF304 domain-containing protein n=1 Tax=Paenibacillus radicis (ex Xue et al. 2023) TaxID=2972489 RepID=A0ABT1YNL2_9BACL|nr:hypothetical protein [Paenibacillus radicis (ex Xue et al. 2023)]MCR8634757.1 hypothetical protein [Paenibacillus radicis (ex Xue et al. 2023)]